MSDLAKETCIPCRGGVPPLPRDEAETLLRQVPGWRLNAEATQIARDFTFPDFGTTLAFVVHIGATAEGAGHHPDIAFGWGYANIALQTHAIGGLTRADFVLAAKIDALPLAKLSD
ncbi:4a-hydroxytetrahydrobiopterin dehydratase [Acidisoma silvae]|uniref:Putative pterin-4-alpha-carbinolamine dehydratase n=1 Tax=Acidisoma silvae TaxID=2802396 RepID=A0A964DXS3_9PROT|nr:4a-hydroxytetrahydrobiopterin dehydratase [Acidisoma silvae]MCB8874023.1 4a-hydroxytetrahydrobiopterin dehydratase [Acidisoma silvae]